MFIERLEKIDVLKTFKSEEIGFATFISIMEFENRLSILESEKDHVIACKYPLDATTLCAKLIIFCLGLSVFLSLSLVGLISLILP